MNKSYWHRYRWTETVIFTVGAFVGLAIMDFVVGPLLGIEFFSGDPGRFFIAGAVGFFSGYALQWLVNWFS